MRVSASWGALLSEERNGVPPRTAPTVFFLALASIVASVANAQTPRPAPECPPPARVDSAKDKYGTTVVADPYRWLEDQESPETRAWVAAQHKCTEAALSNLPGRAQITKRLGELLHTDSFEIPVERGGRYFFRKRMAGQDLFLLYMRRGASGSEEVLIEDRKSVV